MANVNRKKYTHSVDWKQKEEVVRNNIKGTLLTRVHKGELQFSMTICQVLSGGRTGKYVQFHPSKTAELISEVAELCDDIAEDILTDFNEHKDDYKDMGFDRQSSYDEGAEDEDYQPRRPRRTAVA
jgi:hypothetical protein